MELSSQKENAEHATGVVTTIRVLFPALNAVKNLTVVTTNDSALIAWENPAEQQPCVAHRLVRLALSESDAVTTGTLQTESARYSATALEPCGTYRGHVTAVDFAGDRGSPAPFDFTADIASA